MSHKIELVESDNANNENNAYNADNADETKVTIVSFGSADAGKSTLLSLLSLFIILDKNHDKSDPNVKAKLKSLTEKMISKYPRLKDALKKISQSEKYDDANGLLRNVMAKHNHEINTRHTSDINSIPVSSGNGKTYTFVDLCGQQKYLKTTVRGISSHYPDYAIGVISTQSGITEITKNHFDIVSKQNIPIILVITHIDTCHKASFIETKKGIKEMCGSKFKPIFINTLAEYKTWQYVTTGKVIGPTSIEEKYNVQNPKYNNIDGFKQKEKTDIEYIKKHFTVKFSGKQNIIPVISVSNVNGYYISPLINIINYMEPRDIWNQTSENNRMLKQFQKKLGITDEILKDDFKGTLFYIDQPWKKEGCPGIIVSGILRGESIKIGDTMFIGPFEGYTIEDKFAEVEIKSIHNNNREEVDILHHHDRGCCRFTIVSGTKSRKDLKNKINKKDIKKGFCLLTKNHLDNLCWTINVSAEMFNTGSINIKPGWKPVLDIGNIRQDACVQIDETFVEELDQNGKKRLIKKMEINGTGSIINLKFKFIKNPELVTKGSFLTFRSGQVHGVGIVNSIVKIVDEKDPTPMKTRQELKILKARKMRDNITDKLKNINIKLK